MLPVHTPGKSGSGYALIKIFRIAAAAAVSGAEQKRIGAHSKKYCRQPVGDSRHKHYVDAGLFYIIAVVPAILPYGKAVFSLVGVFPKALQPDGTQQKHTRHNDPHRCGVRTIAPDIHKDHVVFRVQVG